MRATLAVLTILAVVAILVAALTPRIDLNVAAQCLSGEGFAFVDLSGEPFEAQIRGHTYRGTTDNVIDLYVRVVGAWEPYVLDLMTDVLEKMYGGTGVMVDVGANTGTLSIVMTDHASQVHAIEPWPPVVERMKAMVAENGVDNLFVHEVGYADEPGVLPFYEPEDSNLGVGSFSSEGLFAKGTQVDLPLVRGDEHLAAAGVTRVDLIKIDIQGYEKPALAGLRATLERDRPIVLMELAVEGAVELGYFSEADLRASFPTDYAFYRIAWVERTGWTQKLWGRKMLLCWDTKPQYYLEPFDMTFVDDGSHTNLLIVPQERVEELARQLGGRMQR